MNYGPLVSYIIVFFLYLFAVLRLCHDGIMRNVFVPSSFVNTVVIFSGSEMFCIRGVFYCNGSGTVKLARTQLSVTARLKHQN